MHFPAVPLTPLPILSPQNLLSTSLPIYAPPNFPSTYLPLPVLSNLRQLPCPFQLLPPFLIGPPLKKIKKKKFFSNIIEQNNLNKRKEYLVA